VIEWKAVAMQQQEELAPQTEELWVISGTWIRLLSRTTLTSTAMRHELLEACLPQPTRR